MFHAKITLDIRDQTHHQSVRSNFHFRLWNLTLYKRINYFPQKIHAPRGHSLSPRPLQVPPLQKCFPVDSVNALLPSRNPPWLANNLGSCDAHCLLPPNCQVTSRSGWRHTLIPKIAKVLRKRCLLSSASSPENLTRSLSAQRLVLTS